YGSSLQLLRRSPKLEHLFNSARNDEYDSAFPVLFLLELKISEPVCRICKSTNSTVGRPILKEARNWKLRVHRYFDWAVASMVALTYATRYCVRPSIFDTGAVDGIQYQSGMEAWPWRWVSMRKPKPFTRSTKDRERLSLPMHGTRDRRAFWKALVSRPLPPRAVHPRGL